MNSNITYTINEPGTSSEDDKFSWKEIELENTMDYMDNENFAKELDYKLNYSNKYLQAIMDFYGLKKSKLNKELISKTIVEFESKIQNEKIINKRKRLFENIEELKNDEYFRKFIIWNI